MSAHTECGRVGKFDCTFDEYIHDTLEGDPGEGDLQSPSAWFCAVVLDDDDPLDVAAAGHYGGRWLIAREFSDGRWAVEVYSTDAYREERLVTLRAAFDRWDSPEFDAPAPISPNVTDKQAWSRAKAIFRELSAPGMEWEVLTEDQRLYWRRRAVDILGPEPVEMLLWQVSLVYYGGKQVTFYLDAGVQGLPTGRDALQWVADNAPSHSRVAVMAITYQILPHVDLPTVADI